MPRLAQRACMNLNWVAIVVNGVHDEMIPVPNSYRLSENLPNAVLLTYPDAGHGSLCQYPESISRHAAAFLSSDSESAAFADSYDPDVSEKLIREALHPYEGLLIAAKGTPRETSWQPLRRHP